METVIFNANIYLEREKFAQALLIRDGVIAQVGTNEEVLSAAAGQARVVRVAFNGGTSYQPLIATLAIDCGVKANILGADTRNIDGRAFGTMLLGLPREGAGKAMAYIRAQKDITVEEVQYRG